MKIFVEHPTEEDKYWGVFVYCQEPKLLENMLSLTLDRSDWDFGEDGSYIVSVDSISTILECLNVVGEVILLGKEYLFVGHFMEDVMKHLDGGVAE